VLKALGRYDGALQCIERAIQLAPDDGNYWDSKGEMYLGTQRYQEALAAFDRALELTPTLALTRGNKAISLRALGREAEAQEAERQAKELGG
jgi:tetratricopeptide (TPR) repeat protein